MTQSLLNRIRSVITFLMQKGELILRVGFKFVAFYILFRTISGMEYFTHTGIFNRQSVQLVLALAATLLPNRGGVLIALLIFVYNFFQTSVLGAVLVGLAMLLVYIACANLFPEQTFILALVPFFIHWKMFMTLPLFCGMYMGLIAIVPMLLGILMYVILEIAPLFLNLELGEAITDIPEIITKASAMGVDQIKQNDMLVYLIVTSAICIVIVSLLRRLRISYTRYIAIGAGGLFSLIAVIVGINRHALTGSVGVAMLFVLLTVALMCLIEFLNLSLNYKTAKNLEFEDEDYLYQVHMIPKNQTLSKKRRIQQLKENEKESGRAPEEAGGESGAAAKPKEASKAAPVSDKTRRVESASSEKKEGATKGSERASSELRNRRESASHKASGAAGKAPAKRSSQASHQNAAKGRGSKNAGRPKRTSPTPISDELKEMENHRKIYLPGDEEEVKDIFDELGKH